jgi:hypothetical protein
MIIALLENRPFARDLEVLGRIGHTSGGTLGLRLLQAFRWGDRAWPSLPATPPPC